MNLEQAEYMIAVHRYLSGHGDTSGMRLEDRCPECELTPGDDPLFEWLHGVIPGETEGVIVIIGCEDGRIINPNRVGIKAPNWQPPEFY